MNIKRVLSDLYNVFLYVCSVNISRLLPSWKRWVYCQGLVLENVTYHKSDLWQKVVDIYFRQHRDVFELLLCPEHDHTIEHFLETFDNIVIPNYGYIPHERTNVSLVTNVFDMFAKQLKNVASLNMLIITIQNALPK